MDGCYRLKQTASEKALNVGDVSDVRVTDACAGGKADGGGADSSGLRCNDVDGSAGDVADRSCRTVVEHCFEIELFVDDSRNGEVTICGHRVCDVVAERDEAITVGQIVGRVEVVCQENVRDAWRSRIRLLVVDAQDANWTAAS